MDESAKDAEKRKIIREHLGKLLSEGDGIRNTVCLSPNPQCEKERTQWEQKVERYLKANLDSSYADRWRSNIVKIGGSPWAEMWQEVDILNKFIVELK